MLIPAPEHAAADAAFERLRQSSAYVFENEDSKQQMLRTVWSQCMTTLSLQLAEEEFGFGFFVEAFAKESTFLKARQNTKKAVEIESFLLDCLQRDPYFIFGDGGSRCNPDHIWIRLRGRRVVCAGIAEVKASLQAIEKKPEQLHLQERNVRRIIEYIEKNRRDLNIPFLRQRTFELADTLECAVIIPRASDDIRSSEHIPRGWSIVPIEWSYDELIFLAQHIRPELRKDKRFGENEYADYIRSVKRIFDRAKEIIEIFFQDIPLTSDSLDLVTLTTTAFGFYPRNEDDVLLLQKTFPAGLPNESLFRNLDAPSIRRYSKEEQVLFEKIRQFGLSPAHRERFLATRRLLCNTYRKKIGVLMERLPAFNPFEHF